MKQLKRAIYSSAFTLSSYAHSGDFASQFFDPLDGKFDVSGFISDNAYGFLPIPVVITEPALGEGLGVVGVFFHEKEEARVKRMEAAKKAENAAAFLMPPSVSAVMAAGTSNDSWLSGGGHMGFYHEGKLRYVGFGGYGSVNLNFYLEGSLLSRQEVNFDTLQVEINNLGSIINQSLKFRIADSKIFLGVKQNYVSAEMSVKSISVNDKEILDKSDEILSLLDTTLNNSGAGVVFEWDTRDNLFGPRKGYNYTAEVLTYHENIGGDFKYTEYVLEGLNYWTFFSDMITTGLRLGYSGLETDEVLPPFAYPFINMRGIPAARYQGESVIFSELEAIWRLTNRWSLVGFIGGGRTAGNFSDLSDSTSQIGKGGGFRYQIARRYGFNMGIDIAHGPEETAWYIMAGASW